MRRLWESMNKKWLAGPYLVWMVGFIVIPLLMIVYYGLTDKSGAFTLANVLSISTPEHVKALWLSLGLSLVSTVICLLLAYPLAMILRNRGIGQGSFIVFIFILPMWMNFLLRTLAWQTLLEKSGVINGILTALHLPNQSLINTPGAIILGMVICNTVGVHAVFRDGLRFSTTLTKTGIVVMGCKYSFAGLIKTGSEAIIIISVFLFTSAIILMWLSRRLSMSPSLGACLAAGLSICGVSACVAIAPAVRAKNEDIAYTIAVVLMFGLLALFIFPFIGHWLDLSPNQFGAFAGVGIVNSAQVLAAGFAFSNDAGIVAGVYNIGRVICLPLVVLMLAIMVAAEDAKVHSQLANTSKMRIILDKFPVFVLGFLAVVLLNTFGFMSKEEAKMAGNFMNWCFLLGFSSIGLTTHLSDIKAAGLSGALIGFCVASVKAGLALLVVLCFLQ